MNEDQGKRQDLFVPDRFEGLRDAGSGALKSIIVPVRETLDELDARFVEMRAARRGSFMILHGDSGSGKSTFLDTAGLFRMGVATERVPASDDVRNTLNGLGPADWPRIVIIEGREALGEVSAEALEASMHAINAFVRSDIGRETLVVWPANTTDLTENLAGLGDQIGAEALFGTGPRVTNFLGPPQTAYVGIGERTIAALNEGASLAALGISQDRAAALATSAKTVGHFLALVRDELVANNQRVQKLLPTEQYRVWTVAIAGNDPEGDVAALTRGGYAYADIDRLMTATGANIVKGLKERQEDVGILGTVLDARIMHVDMMTVLAVAREFGDAELHELMKTEGMSTQPDKKAPERIEASELGVILAGNSLGTRRRGSKPGGGTQTAFGGLAKIARTRDVVLNRALGTALKAADLIDDFEVERDLGTELTYTSDLYVVKAGEPIRLEVMWRSKAGRADLANYVLTKLGNYGKAIGLLS